LAFKSPFQEEEGAIQTLKCIHVWLQSSAPFLKRGWCNVQKQGNAHDELILIAVRN
jgi:hypothetical protein